MHLSCLTCDAHAGGWTAVVRLGSLDQVPKNIKCSKQGDQGEGWHFAIDTL